MPRVSPIPLEQRDQMVEAYLKGQNAREAAGNFGFSSRACLGELHRRGIKRRTNAESHRKYSFDERFFCRIDSPAKAYWLGFVAADGCVSRTSLIVTLQRRDWQHLELLRASLKAEHPVLDAVAVLRGRRYPAARFLVTSATTLSDLASWGIVGRKSRRLRTPVLPWSLQTVFWRGVFDGDGTIGRNGRPGTDSGRYWRIRLSGNWGMTCAFRTWVRSATGQRLSMPRRDKRGRNLFVVGCGGSSAPLEVLRLLYEGRGPFLVRKRELAELALTEWGWR